MPSLNDVTPGSSVDSSCVQQVIDAWKGTAGKGVPLTITAVNDATNFALDVINNEATNGRAVRIRDSSGAVQFQADATGVTMNQVAISSATLTSPTINGAIAGTAGFGAWSTFTPTLLQNSSAPGFTITRARYNKIGKTAFVSVQLNVTSTGAVATSSALVVGAIPATISPTQASTSLPVGNFVYVRIAGQIYKGAAVFNTTNSLHLYSDSTGGNVSAALGLTPLFTIANGDSLSLNLTYEAT
jgi:hypothetical protein